VLSELARKNRSIRRFDEQETVTDEALRSLIELARFSAVGMNLQPLKFILSVDPETNRTIFPHLSWARRLRDWPGPEEGERPSAYVVILHDTTIRKTVSGCDHAIAAQSILLGATEMGLGGCMIASVDREGLRETLGIPEHLEIPLVVAIGKPAETVVIDDLAPGGDTAYYRDRDDRLHVPKRGLDELILRSYS